MDIYQIIEEVNKKEIMGEEICPEDKERMVSFLLAGAVGREETNHQERHMPAAGSKAYMGYLYPVFFLSPHEEKKHRLFQGFLPKTYILAGNYYELESLRILVKFAPDHPRVRQMTVATVNRLRHTCFGNSCMKGECLAAGISVLRFLAAACPNDEEWIEKLLTPLGELFESFSGQAAVQKGIPVSYLLVAFTDINNDKTRQLMEEKKEWLMTLLQRDGIIGKHYSGKNAENGFHHLLCKPILLNALKTCPSFSSEGL